MINRDNLNAAQAEGFARRHGGVVIADRTEDKTGEAGDLTSPGTFNRPNPNDIAQTSFTSEGSHYQPVSSPISDNRRQVNNDPHYMPMSNDVAVGRKMVHALLDVMRKSAAGPLTATVTELHPGGFKTVIRDASGKEIASQLGLDPKEFLEEYGLGKSGDDASNVLRKSHSGLSKADWEAASAGDLSAIRKMAAATESKWIVAKGFSGRLSTGQPLAKHHSDHSFRARWARKFGGAV